MAAACPHSMVAASSRCCALPSGHGIPRATPLWLHKGRSSGSSSSSSRVFFSAGSASSSPPSADEDSADCNAEDCAPDKEVGKVSMEWLAGEKTRVVGTFPPRRKGWTGYVEKDTAGQTNIYSIEPTVYVAENAISSGSAGSSSEGAENTAALAAGFALISVAAASSILLQVGKNAPQVQTTVYSGPPLSYYISKFKPVSSVEAAAPAELQSAPPVESEGSASDVTQVQAEFSDQIQEQLPQILVESGDQVQEPLPQVQVELSNQVQEQEGSQS